jgi:Helix-turn-helix of DDE superfamily endonuclease
MGQRRYEDVVQDPAKLQALTSLTVEEFEELVGPFETAFREHMSEWTLEGKRRQKRAYVSYANSPLPTADERLLFILSYLKENPTQTYHALLYGLTQPKANLWIHALFRALRLALRAMGDAPARSFAELMERLERQEAATTPTEAEEQQPPLLPTTAPSARSRDHSTTGTSGFTTAARSTSTRSRTSSL